MSKKYKAHVQMEERYARLEIDYDCLEEKRAICNYLNDLIAIHKISPQITIEPKTTNTGEYIMEFHDDYDKKAGVFFEDLLEKLDIKKCD